MKVDPLTTGRAGGEPLKLLDIPLFHGVKILDSRFAITYYSNGSKPELWHEWSEAVLISNFGNE
jgi:hypothetical protein